MANGGSKRPAPAAFVVKCSRTKPGELVFVVGSAAALGAWDPAKAVPLGTTAEAFPQWSSATLQLPADQAVEYKFIVQREDRTGEVTWERFEGNRVLEVATGCVVTATSAWDSLQSTVTTSAVNGAPAADSASWQATEEALLGIGKAGALAWYRHFAAALAGREPLRRNVSQSLLGLSWDLEAAAAGGGIVAQAIDVGFAAGAALGAKLQSVVEQQAAARGARKALPRYSSFNLDVPVVIVTSEIAPWSKSGGLGLIAASYSYEFARNGHRTMAISPKYGHYEHLSCVGEAHVEVNGRRELVRYWHRFVDFRGGRGCDYVFVDHPSLEREGGLYNGPDGREYGDNLFRFTLLSLAALEAPLLLHLGGFPYGEKVLFLANDWQSGLVPLYLCYKYRCHERYLQARAIYVVHNLGYQGQYPHVNASHFFGVDGKAARDLAFGDCVSLTKGALICADRVLTVSPNYASEIQTPEGGFGLHEFVRKKASRLRLFGILNGIDDCWNPSTDTHIAQNYSEDDLEAGKRANKAALQRMLGLHQDPGVVLVGFVGRLAWQKGVDLLGAVVGWLMEDTGNGVTGRVQLAMMGDEQYADTVRWAEGAHRGRVCGYVGFDAQVEHQMMAGCDLLLMPSRYEPCGLPQMHAQQYGTLPVVTATGGLRDSVRDVSMGIDTATGFHVAVPTVDKLKEVLYRAMELCLQRPADFRRMQRTAMLTDFYWPQAMDQYEQHVDHALYEPPVVR